MPFIETDSIHPVARTKVKPHSIETDFLYPHAGSPRRDDATRCPRIPWIELLRYVRADRMLPSLSLGVVAGSGSLVRETRPRRPANVSRAIEDGVPLAFVVAT
jgi:hypothetical protein